MLGRGWKREFLVCGVLVVFMVMNGGGVFGSVRIVCRSYWVYVGVRSCGCYWFVFMIMFVLFERK